MKITKFVRKNYLASDILNERPKFVLDVGYDDDDTRGVFI